MLKDPVPKPLAKPVAVREYGYATVNNPGRAIMKPGGQPFEFEAVSDAVRPLDLQGLTVTEVKGFGRQKDQTRIYPGAGNEAWFLPKMMLDAASV